MNHIQSALLQSLPHITHGFGSLLESVPHHQSLEWETRRPYWKQVHGVTIGEVTHAHQDLGQVDAVVTFLPHQPIGIRTADCVPLLLAHRSGVGVAAVHAGWRGTFDRISEHVIRYLQSKGQKTSDWVAALGPSIGPCCYEVSEELAESFAKNFADYPSSLIVPKPRHLDLSLINEIQLRRAGIESIERTGQCTKCLRDAQGSFFFESYRRDGKTSGRQLSIIASKAH